MSFMTESRIEALLEKQTRSLPGPEGVIVTITAFKSLWKAYDFLICFGIYTPERIAQLAAFNSEGLGNSYGESFSAIVWKANSLAREILGIDCFGVRPV